MKIGKCWELTAFKRCKLIGRRLGFTRTQMHVWESSYYEVEAVAFESGARLIGTTLIHRTTSNRVWFLSLWFFTIVLEYCKSVPSRVNGVPQ